MVLGTGRRSCALCAAWHLCGKGLMYKKGMTKTVGPQQILRRQRWSFDHSNKDFVGSLIYRKDPSVCGVVYSGTMSLRKCTMSWSGRRLKKYQLGASHWVFRPL